MKTIGLLGGMSWESTIEYYRIVNEEVRARLGGLHSARLLLHSVDFAPIEDWMRRIAWSVIAVELGHAAFGLQQAGADCLVICTNTMHRLAPQITARLHIPLIHIADATAAGLPVGTQRVALLGTRPTMEKRFFRGRLSGHGVATVVPNDADRQFVHDAIFRKLCLGQFLDSTRQRFIDIIEELVQRGAQATVLDCTEIPLLIRPDDVSVPLLDTTELHAKAAVDFALS